MKVLQNAGDRLGVAGCSGEVLLKRQRVVGSEKLALKWTYHTNLDIVLQDAGLRAQIGLLHCQHCPANVIMELVYSVGSL